MSFIFQTHFVKLSCFFSSLTVGFLTQEVAVSSKYYATIIKTVKILGFQKGSKPNRFLVTCHTAEHSDESPVTLNYLRACSLCYTELH